MTETIVAPIIEKFSSQRVNFARPSEVKKKYSICE